MIVWYDAENEHVHVVFREVSDHVLALESTDHLIADGVEQQLNLSLITKPLAGLRVRLFSAEALDNHKH